MGLLCPLILATENQAGFFVFLDEPRDNWERRTQETLDFRARAIAHSKQNDFGWTTQEDTAFFEIRIFGNYGEAVCFGIFPDRRIVRTTQAAWMNVGGAREKIGQYLGQMGREILVEKKLHALSISSLRSRSAAKARQARISSSVK